jgi:SSS family transporter
MAGNFGMTGYVVLAIYLLATLGLGLSFARKQDSLAGYFLAERSASWWAVGISVLACDLSAISYMGAPAYTYFHDLRYPMSTFIYPLVAWLVAVIFIPFLAQLQVYTIYEYLEHRFSLSSRLFASAIFSLQRASHMAIAIYAISLALQEIIGWPVWACVTLIGSVTTLYTVLGGMRAVIWTDVMQFFVLVGGIFAMAGAVLWKFDGDVAHIWNVAAEGGHTRMFSFDSNFLEPAFWKELTVWGIFFGMLVSNTAAYGSDQALVQRYIAAGSGKMMAKSLMFSALLQIPVAILLFLLGFGFLAYYQAPENTALLASLDELIQRTGDNRNMVMPHFILHVLPPSLGGLVFAGLFAATMSVFSSGLNSLSTVACVDFIQRLTPPNPESGGLTVTTARWVTLVWGIVVTLAAIAVYSADMGMVVEAAAAVIGFFSGPLLGMFLLGMVSVRANSLGAIGGALAGFAVSLVLWNHVSFVWYAVTGCLPTLVFGYMLSFLAPPSPEERAFPMTFWGRAAKDVRP